MNIVEDYAVRSLILCGLQMSLKLKLKKKIYFKPEEKFLAIFLKFIRRTHIQKKTARI